MIKREKDTKAIVFHCDNCSEHFTEGTDDFTYTLSQLKKAKWSYQKEQDDGWSHYCPSCTKKK
jgi:ribosomal protein L37AE/L43A